MQVKVTVLGRALCGAGFGFCSLLLAMTLSWLLLAQLNFLYPIWHDHAGINAGIEKYGPKNRYKAGFADTDRRQRTALFAAINDAVHNRGLGLDGIRYQSVSSGGPQDLLREPEIVHLQDVANLISVLKGVAVANAFAWLCLLVVIVRSKRRLIRWRAQLTSLSLLLLVSISMLLALGPVNVFNQLHIWVFPKEHQWFFYYQESLMSTMMLAPTLFGWIAAALLALAVAIFIALLFTVIRAEKAYKK